VAGLGDPVNNYPCQDNDLLTHIPRLCMMFREEFSRALF